MIESLITIRQFCQKHPWPSEAGMRWLIFKSEENGLEKCIVRIGRRVLIDEKAFFEWAGSYSNRRRTVSKNVSSESVVVF